MNGHLSIVQMSLSTILGATDLCYAVRIVYMPADRGDGHPTNQWHVQQDVQRLAHSLQGGWCGGRRCSWKQRGTAQRAQPMHPWLRASLSHATSASPSLLSSSTAALLCIKYAASGVGYCLAAVSAPLSAPGHSHRLSCCCYRRWHVPWHAWPLPWAPQVVRRVHQLAPPSVALCVL